MLRARVTIFCLIVLSAVVHGQAPPAHPPRLTGTILDTTMRPVPDANFTLLGVGETRTDSAGFFRFTQLPAGSLIFRITKIGYRPVMKMLQLHDGDSLNIDVTLLPTTHELEPIQVIADRYTPENDRTGFERRRLNGFGKYLSTERILKSHTHDVSMLLRTLGGVVIDRNNVIHLDHGVTTLVGTPCRGAQVFINGVRMGEGFDVSLIPVETVRGVEMYNSSASLPMEFRTDRSACGTVLIWTW